MTPKVEEEGFAPLPGAENVTVPQPPGGQRAAEADFVEARSLREDVEILIEDGKTYLEAELNFQRTRALYVADSARSAMVHGAVAAAFGFLALIGLTVGLIIALTPWLTAWGASALVVGLLILAGVIALRGAMRRWNRLMEALGRGDEASE